MKLVSLKVENFRCYEVPFTVKIDSFTAIVGRNDIGKSALFEALSIFFEQSKMDHNDASVDGVKDDVRITCIFSDLPEKLILDSNNPTTLASEYLLNDDGNLEITKIYNATLATPKVTKIYAKAHHPTAEKYSDLLILKRADLVKRAGELSVNLEDVNQTINAELREAIWSSSDNLQLVESEVDLQKEAGKQIWDALSNYLPTFWLFKSDRASTDQDAEAQDPLKAAIAEAVKAVESDLENITDKIKAEVAKVAELTLEKLSEMDAELSATLNPVITTKKWESLFQTSVTGDRGIPLNKRGSGVRRLILLNFFRAQVEARASETDNAAVIYAIEEPETSQHPSNQRLLFTTLQQLTTDSTRQVMITSHTPMLVRAVPDNQLRYIHNNGPNRAITSGGKNVNNDIAKSLGVLADHSVKVFIGVEGPNDISFLTEISKVLSQADENVINLEKLVTDGQIIFIPLGGSCLALWVDRLKNLNKPEIHFCDRDHPPDQDPKYYEHVNAINAREGCLAYNTTKREMENYIHPQAIKEAYAANGTDLRLPNTFQNIDDVPLIVAKALHKENSQEAWDDVSEEKQKQKCSKVKRMINGEAAKRMDVARLKECNGYEEILMWFNSINELIKKSDA